MHWIYYLDLFGVAVFALSGGMDAIRHRLDILGLSVLAVATGLGGGMVRDTLLGIHPPGSFTDPAALIACLVAALLAYLFAAKVARLWPWVRVADALGLGIFAALGAQKALQADLGLVPTVIIATLSAAGGGVVRDLLVREVPLILRGDFYASAAALGGFVMWLLYGVVTDQVAIAVAFVCATGSRLLAIRYGFQLPSAARGQNPHKP